MQPIGYVESVIIDRHAAPKMETEEGAVSATIHILPEYRDALLGLEPGMRIILLTWLHEADRSVLQCHPRRDPTRAKKGVFATRSPHRPNPIGLHHVTITDVHGDTITVDALEVINGTPILDIKKE